MKKLSRREQAAQARRDADISAQLVGRDDIDYESDCLPAPPRVERTLETRARTVLMGPELLSKAQERDRVGESDTYVLSHQHYKDLEVAPLDDAPEAPLRPRIRLTDLFPHGILFSVDAEGNVVQVWSMKG